MCVYINIYIQSQLDHSHGGLRPVHQTSTCFRYTAKAVFITRNDENKLTIFWLKLLERNH